MNNNTYDIFILSERFACVLQFNFNFLYVLEMDATQKEFFHSGVY